MAHSHFSGKLSEDHASVPCSGDSVHTCDNLLDFIRGSDKQLLLLVPFLYCLAGKFVHGGFLLFPHQGRAGGKSEPGVLRKCLLVANDCD